MDFRLLGPMELHVDGRVIDIGPPQRRAVLAALAVDVGLPVPLETLVERVWDGAAPQAASAAIYAHIARIRRLPAPICLRRLAGGYLLDADRDCVDLHRFRRLIAAARGAPPGGGPAREAAQAAALGEALRLWRGVPLSDVHGQWAARVRHGVEQQLTESALAWAAIHLRSGSPESAIDRLSDLVAVYPLNELLVAMLVRVLCEAGHVAEALARFSATRDRLRDQLAAEPGAELRELHEAIVRGDFDTTAPRGAAPGRPVPRQLPADIAWFTGRAEELAVLRDMLLVPDRPAVRPIGPTGPVVISAIDGAGGVGKSGLAIHAAHQVAGAFPDGQLYVDLRGATDGLAPLEPIEVLGRFLRALGVGGNDIPSDPDEASARFRTQVAGRRLLVVLDNATDEAQVRPLLPGAPGCGVLVTSRRTLAGLDAGCRVRLDVLSPHEAVRLLAALVGPERVAAEPEAAEAAARRCGYLPLALRIAGARLAARPGWPLAVLADRLAREQRRLDELEVADLGVRTSFTVSHNQLRYSASATDREAAQAFVMLGTWDGPELGVPMAARLLDVGEDRAERVLDHLVSAGLLEPARPGRFRLHDLLRLYARELAASVLTGTARTAALDRVLHCYVATLWHTLALTRPGDPRLDLVAPGWSAGGLEFPDASAALAWLETERANLLAAVLRAASADLHTAVLQLAPATFVFFLQRGYWLDCVRLNRTALAVAERCGDRLAQAQALCDLGGAFEFQGRSDDALACICRSLDIHRELDNVSGQAALLNNLGVVHSRQGRHVEALAFVRQGLSLHRRLGNRNGEALNLDTLGAVYGRLRRDDEALHCYAQSLAIHQKLGSRWDEAKTLNWTAIIYVRLGRHDDAMSCVRQSLAICEDLGSPAGRASNLDVLGTILHGRRRYAEALDCHQQSIAIFRTLGQRQDEAEALHHAAAALHALGRTGEVRTHLRQARAIHAQLGLPPPAEPT
ncbi:MAG TPA: tetratricopeptide repeat protein [Candidatus Limnocylindrales bacterium]